ncbi:proteasome subunit beta type-7-like [Scaptodrosophila lebanonensis]|uniref:Proteasome subunit beta type-7-like n=1 Tax=Drosophila lebanonensis TaxID=7225 RepID=A0A6J2TSX2_DROLE|nr:proteasome subunit beta type-7-like [Scaptodrosophila lebanonensis]
MSNASGFNFDNITRNTFLKIEGLKEPKTFTTGSTIVGVVYEDGVILGAGEQASDGNVVISHQSRKIHRLQNNIYCGAAGKSADITSIVGLLQSQLRLHYLEPEQPVPVVCANTFARNTLFHSDGNIMANLLIGGVWNGKAELYCTWYEGCSEKISFASLGSGLLAAKAVLGTQWRRNLAEVDALQVVHQAVAAGIGNDPSSDDNISIVVLRCDGSVEQTTFPIGSFFPNSRLGSTPSGGSSESSLPSRASSSSIFEILAEKVSYKLNNQKRNGEDGNKCMEEIAEPTQHKAAPKRSGSPSDDEPPMKKRRCE